MQNIFSKEKIISFTNLIESANKIAIITHTNPDGDAIGSASALKLFLQKKYDRKQVRAFIPNAYPQFLQWVADNAQMEICNPRQSDTTEYDEKAKYIRECDIIIITDLNSLDRTDHLHQIINENKHCKIALIDHHESPMEADLVFQNRQSSSTCFLVFTIIDSLDNLDLINQDIATALYTGIITDTGCFSYSYLTPELFSTVAELIKRGADPVRIHQRIYDTQSENRLRLLGYLINNKMKIIHEKNAAYITLSQKEKDKFHYRIGDTEGVVNYPLSIKEISTSALFTESDGYIKVSLRSQGDMINVDLIARQYFNGGGHFNAAGGKFYGTLEEAEKTYIIAINTSF